MSVTESRTQRGAGFFGIRAFTEEVAIAGDATLEFTTADWFTPKTVVAEAADDDKVDGQDSQSFPTQLDLANNILGPLVNPASAPCAPSSSRSQ